MWHTLPMAFPKISKETHGPFRAALPADPRVGTHSMFGGLAAMVNGNMFAGLWADGVVVRLSPVETRRALEVKGAGWFDPRGSGKPMLGMVFLPRELVADARALKGWLSRALEHTGTAVPPNKEKLAKQAAKAKAPAKKKATVRKR